MDLHGFRVYANNAQRGGKYICMYAKNDNEITTHKPNVGAFRAVEGNYGQFICLPQWPAACKTFKIGI